MLKFRNAMTAASIVTLVMLSRVPVTMADDVSQLEAQVQQLNSRLEQVESEKKSQIERLSSRLEKVESQKSDRVEKEELARMMKDILDDAKASPALPSWLKNLTFYGDFRLRFEHQSAQGRRGPWGTGSGTPKDRNRIRMRLRFGFTKTWWDDQMEVGFRLATGEDNHPAGTNQTMTGDFSKKNVWIDLMYAKYKPKWAKGLEIGAGKVLNPIKTRTFMTWDSGLNPEGIYVDYVSHHFGDFKPYGQIGFWFVNEDGTRQPNTTVRDTVMLSYGAGFEWKFQDNIEWFFGATYYDYYNADASTGTWLGRYGADGQWASGPGGTTPNENINNVPAAALPCADFGILELTTKVAWKLAFLPEPLQKWTAWFSFVHNCKDDYNTQENPVAVNLASTTLVGADRHFKNDPNAFGMGIKVGENKKRNDISLAYAYYYMEYGSVVPGFGDGTFGGPNNQGHLFQAIYNIDDFLTIGGLMVLYQPIHTTDDPNNSSDPNSTIGQTVNFPHSEDMTATFRLELIWKF